MNRKLKISCVLLTTVMTITSMSFGAFGLFGSSSSSSSSNPNSRISYARVRVSPTRMSLSVGQTRSIDYELHDEYGDYTGGVTWSSSDTYVAEVDSGGTVTAKHPGIVNITARTGTGTSATCEVAVTGRLYPGDPYYDYFDGYLPNNPWNYNYSSSSRVSSSSSSRTSTSRTTTRTSTNANVSLTDKVSRETVLGAVQSLNTGGYATFNDYASVSADTLQAAWDIKDCTLQFDTYSRGAVMARLSIKTADAAKFSGDVYTGVYVDTTNTSSVTQTFSTYFTNRTKVVRCDQGSFAAPVEIAIKADNLNAANLVFYTYNPSNNVYNRLTVSNAYKDANNYIHFTTTAGGYIIVSDGVLSAI